MFDFEAARRNMVDCQIRTTDVTRLELLNAFLSVPREAFVPENKHHLAYIDEDIEVAAGRYLMEPSPLAKLLQAANLSSGDVVLDIGCGPGYSSALISRLVSTVIALEQDGDLSKSAATTLDSLDYDNVAVVEGELTAGYEEEAPYDVIFIGGAVDEVPTRLFDQLRDGGRLIAVEGQGNAGKARQYTRLGDDVSGRTLFNCALKPLPGFEKAAEFQF